MNKNIVLLLSLLCLAGGCTTGSEPALFEKMEGTGIDFSNVLTENDSMNIINLEYFYRGGGVAVADLNADGLPDLLLGGNMVPTRAYLNLGNFQFEDITETAGLLTKQWVNGISLADINSDGLPDIYLSVGGSNRPLLRQNLFFLSSGTDKNGIPRYRERAAQLGLNSDRATTQAAFFDYDRDGDLDLLLVNTDSDNKHPNRATVRYDDGLSPNTDQLFENRLSETGQFADVSAAAGIRYGGFSLGLAITDINYDGWPDIYVANDHLSNDLFYLNNGDGTFTNRIAELVRSQSYYSMGVVAKDLLNNGLTDIFTLDMLPRHHDRRQKMMMAMNLQRFRQAADFGYEKQFMRNTLQMHQGFTKEGDPVFAEVAQAAGVHNTDWSWGCMAADFDHNGYKDIMVANGYARDITNADFVTYQKQSTFFSGNLDNPEYKAAVLEQPPILLSNFAFANQGGLQFTNVTRAWGLYGPNLSNGLACGDFDLDGDLDLVINHLNAPASIYRNRASQGENHFIRVKAADATGSPVYGVKARLYMGDEILYQELYPVQGYQSAQEPVMHFGFPADRQADSLGLVWPDGTRQVLHTPAPDSVYRLQAPDAGETPGEYPRPEPARPLIVANELKTDWRHQPYPAWGDVEKQQLVPQTYSKEGPLLTWAENARGQLMLYAGSGPEQPGIVLLRNGPGQWEKMEFDKGGMYEDMDAAWLDADGDGDMDLFVASGSVRYRDGHKILQDRLYLQTPEGFELALHCLPDMRTFTREVVKTDFDEDGDQDLLVFGRMKPARFPDSPTSYLLRNDGGVFVNVAAGSLPRKGYMGMVTSAEKADLDGDGQPEIVLAGEWQPVRVLKWNGSRYEERTAGLGLDSLKGWWQSVQIADINADGWPDIIAGNAGLNHPFGTGMPLEMYAADLDGDKLREPLLGWHLPVQQGERKLYPLAMRDQLTAQLPFLKSQYKKYEDFSQADLPQLLELSKTRPERFEINCLKSVVLLNRQGKGFSVQELPFAAQLGPLNAALVRDFNADGKMDLLCMGNNSKLPVSMGWNNGSAGALLLNTGEGFTAVPNHRIGLHLTSEIRDVAPVGESSAVISSYRGPLQVLEWQRLHKPEL